MPAVDGLPPLVGRDVIDVVARGAPFLELHELPRDRLDPHVEVELIVGAADLLARPHVHAGVLGSAGVGLGVFTATLVREAVRRQAVEVVLTREAKGNPLHVVRAQTIGASLRVARKNGDLAPVVGSEMAPGAGVDDLMRHVLPDDVTRSDVADREAVLELYRVGASRFGDEALRALVLAERVSRGQLAGLLVGIGFYAHVALARAPARRQALGPARG